MWVSLLAMCILARYYLPVRFFCTHLPPQRHLPYSPVYKLSNATPDSSAYLLQPTKKSTQLVLWLSANQTLLSWFACISIKLRWDSKLSFLFNCLAYKVIYIKGEKWAKPYYEILFYNVVLTFIMNKKNHFITLAKLHLSARSCWDYFVVVFGSLMHLSKLVLPFQLKIKLLFNPWKFNLYPRVPSAHHCRWNISNFRE